MMKWQQILCIALCFTLFAAVSASADGVEVPELIIGERELPDNEALRFLRSMGVGWNLGNTFDAWAYQGYNGRAIDIEQIWCGVKTDERVIQALQDAGLGTIRIPVSWHDHVDAELKIDSAWLERVAKVAGWAYDRGMHVILNIHHDFSERNSATTLIYPTEARYEASERYMRSIWAQLAARFHDWDDRLIFESFNEPRLVGTNYEWNFMSGSKDCQEALNCIMKLNQVFVDTVRADGGENAARYLMVPSYAAAPANAVTGIFSLPEDSADNRIIVSVHAYTPYNFALNQNGTASFSLKNNQQKQEIVSFMNQLYDRYMSKGIPVVIGEFGSRRKMSGGTENLQDRIDFTAFYTATAAARGMPCLLWDNHAFVGTGELFGVLDRRTFTWKYPEIIEAMVRYGVKEK